MSINSWMHAYFRGLEKALAIPLRGQLISNLIELLAKFSNLRSIPTCGTAFYSYSGFYENPVLSEPENISRWSLLFLVENQKFSNPWVSAGLYFHSSSGNCRKTKKSACGDAPFWSERPKEMIKFWLVFLVQFQQTFYQKKAR